MQHIVHELIIIKPKDLALEELEKARKHIEIAMKSIDYPDSLDDDWDLVDGCLENMKWKIKELEIKGAEAEDPTDRQIDEMILERLEKENHEDNS